MNELFSGPVPARQVNTLLKETVLPPDLRDADVNPQVLYVLARGVCSFAGRVLTIGSAWHTDCFLTNNQAPQPTPFWHH